MDPNTRQAVLATAGAGGSDPLYVDDVFSTYLYTGIDTGAGSTRSINNGIDLSGKGGLVWIKGRSAAWNNMFYDTERGAYNYLLSNTTASNYDIEYESGTSDPNYGLTSFNSDGFTLEQNWVGENHNGTDTCSWSFRKAPGFFDVVTYTGNGTAGKTVAHSLGSVPGMIMVKCTSTGGTNWRVYHRSLGATKAVFLDLTNAENTSIGHWNNTAPTSTQFTLGASNDVNQNGATYVAYIFAHDDQSFGTNEDESIIKCGTFNVSGSGLFDVNLGFEPQFILYKQTSGGMGTPNWYIHDTMRGLAQTAFKPLFANLNNSESLSTTEGLLTVNPLGFKSTSSATSAGDYIYMAIRRPHKPPTAGTEVFKATLQSSSSSFDVGFPTDMVLSSYTGTGNKYLSARLTNASLLTDSNGAETTQTQNYFLFDLQNSYQYGNWLGTPEVITYNFKRAPGFFDVVTYTGNVTIRTITHGLGVAPEFMLVKNRTIGYQWCGYSTVSGAGKSIKLSADVAPFPPGFWNATAPTSSVFTVNANDDANGNAHEFVAYLFATLPGISKVGSYTGTGNAINVDCGFSSGARFVLIKRTDSTGDWFVYDTARGIVSGNDSYVMLNNNTAAVTNTDYIDPLNSGFTVTSSAPTGLNASGGTYFFLAIA